MTQEDRVLNHLITNGSITSLEAINEYGATRLSAIIFNLRKRGYIIETKFMSSKNRFGDTVNFGKYFLRSEKDEH